MKDGTIVAGVSFRPAALELIDAAARLDGVTRSRFVERASVKEARERLDAQSAPAPALATETGP